MGENFAALGGGSCRVIHGRIDRRSVAGPAVVDEALTLLVVDDDEDYRRLMAALLRADNPDAKLIEAGDAIALFEAIESAKPDAAVISMRLAFSDGPGVAVAIRKRHADCRTLVVGPVDPAEARALRTAGCVDEVLARSPRGLAVLAERVDALLRPPPAPAAARPAGHGWQDSAASLAHDLQDPVQIVQHSATALTELDGVRDDPAAERHAARIASNVRRIGELLERFVADASQQPSAVAMHRVALGPIVERVVSAAAERLEEVDGRIDVGELPEVTGDSVQIQRVFENLIGNAIKFHAESPLEIVIRAVRETAGWLLTVADNGAGVPEASAERAFEAFTRLAPAATGGSGIGLATCRDIVEAHRGKIWLASPPAGGTIVYVHWPDDPAGSSAETPE